MKFFLTKDERLKYLGFDDRWAMFFGILLVAGLASFIMMSAIEELSKQSVLTCYLIALAYTTMLWITNRFVAINVRSFFPRNDQTSLRLGLMTISAMFTVVVVKVIVDLIEKIFSSDHTDFANPPLLFSILLSFTLCLMVLSIYEFAYFFTKYRQSILERERLAKANMQAQLTALKQQVNPHFLFNSLNTLVNVIPEDQQLATRFTQRLAAVYRRLLEYRHRELIGLGEELLALQDNFKLVFESCF
ncbi:MAG: histidine kinase [Bacteroidota bacterium]